MKTNFRRIFSLILALAMAISLLPAGLIGASAENGGEANVPTVFTAEDYALVDALFEKIEAMENAPAKKNSTQTQLTDAAEAIVLASDNYLEGSLDRNGDFFSWMTDEGIRCCYNPRMRKIRKEMNAPEPPEPSGAFNEPVFTKGGWPTSSEVYLIAPYYGIDESFTDQYKHEAEDIAEAIGDTSGYTLYSGSAATVDKVADAVSNGAVVIFDSHGSTDYYDPNNELDFVTGATSSYLCLSTMDGLTDEDYADGAMYSLEGDAFVNGAVIANHMSKNSPSGLLWMAICLGMATDTLCEPMRSKGVEVVYGYSQSVSFGGDYLFEEVFWDEMIASKTVAQSIASMKSEWGNWDWSTEIAAYYGYDDGYATISDARADYIAFPIVVSDEDTHPGQRKGSNYGADILQTVNSTYTLYSQYNVTATSNNTAYGTVSLSGNKITATPATGYYAAGYTVIAGSANVTQDGNSFTVNALSDCTVQINFAAKTPLTVTFYENGTVGSTIQTYSGDPLTLPDHKTTVPTNYKFLGWVERTVNNVTDKPNVLAVGSEQTAKATAYYALYSHVEGGSSGTGEWALVTDASTLNVGDRLVITSNTEGVAAGTYTAATNPYLANSSVVTFSSDKSTIATLPDDAMVFILGGTSSAWTLTNEDGKKLGATAVKKMALDSGTTTWTITIGSAGAATIQNTTSSYGRILHNVQSTRFTTYTSDTNASMLLPQIYRQGSGGTIYYTTSTCAHTNTTSIAAQAASCTEIGYTAGVQCTSCGTFVSGHEVVEALGHAYHSVVTPPTETEQGYTTHTCSRCGDTKVDTYVPALGKSYTVSFTVPTGVTAIADMTANSNDGITLPTAGVPTGDKTYTFVGWVETAVDNSTEKPTFYAAGANYKPEGNVVLNALYTYTEGGSGSVTNSYTVSDYAAGTQYAENEEHVLDDTLTVYTTQAHWTTELRLYSSSTHNGFAVFQSTNPISALKVNAGYKVDVLNVYGSNDNGATWTLVEGVKVASEYADYTVTCGTAYRWLKFDVEGTNQLRIKYFELTTVAGTTYYTTVIGGSTEPDEPDEPDVPDEPEEETFRLSFRVPAGYNGVAAIKGNGAVTLPAAPTLRIGLTGNVSGYTFVGWVEQEYADVTAKPTVYLAGSSYTLSTDTVLYALFTYDVTETITVPGTPTAEQKIEFALGTNGSATHVDPSSSKTTYSETQGAYTLSISSGVNMYPGACDAKGNGCIKVGSSKKTGSFSFTVPQDVTSVVFYVAKYKEATSKITINGTAYTLTKNSNDGAYDEITVDTSANKTVSFASATGGIRCMINTIAFVVPGMVGEPTVEEITTTYYTTKEGHDTEADEFAFFAGASVTLGDVLDLNFYVDATEGYLSDDLKVIFTYVGRDGTASDEMVYSAQIYDIDVNGYQFYLSLPAVYMATAVQAVLKDGNTVLQTVNYSIQEYAMSIVNGSYAQKHKDAATAMLNYGAMAQNYFAYKTDALANSTLTNGKFTTTDAELAAAGDLTGYHATITNRASNFIGYTLLLKDVTYIRLYFTEQVTVTLNGEEKTAVKDGDKARYYVEIPGVNAANLGTANTVVCGEMAVNNLSVLSLASQVAEDTAKSEAFRNAMIALILYAQSVTRL